MQSQRFAADAEEPVLVRPWYLIAKQSQFKMVWDFVIMMTVIYVTTINPLRIAFLDIDSTTSMHWFISDFASDILLFADIFFNFFVIEEDALGLPIITLKGIAKHYLRTYFFLDFFSAFPISSIVQLTFIDKDQKSNSIAYANLMKSTRLYKLFVLLKILRIVRMSKIIERIINALHFTPAVSALAANLTKTTFLLHFIGCVWGIVAASTNMAVRENWIRSKGLESADSVTRYLTSCYWAVVTMNTVGYGEIAPTNVYEVFANILIIWTGVTT